MKNNPDLKVSIGDINLQNPVMTASGTFGYANEFSGLFELNRLGAIIVKGLSIEPSKGNKPQRIVETPCGMLNAIGLENVGFEVFLQEKLPFLKTLETPIFINIYGKDIVEYTNLASRIDDIEGISGIEVNISCPNVEAEFGKPFGTDPNVSFDVTKIVKKNSKVPVIVKLSPNVPNIKIIAKAVEKAKADAISAINTIGPGMVINLETGKPVLANKVGGVSGPAIRPVAVRCVYDIYSTVKIPVLGIGGVTYGRDAIEMMMAGASAVGIGTAVYYRGTDVFRKVCCEIEEFMSKNGYNSLKEIIGKAHGTT